MLDDWAERWGIPADAITDLLACIDAPPGPPGNGSEARVLSVVRLEESRKGARLFRNNVGACYDQHGNFIRYGLANDSTALNKRIKSSDLIGIRPVLIEPGHVGSMMGQFVARECKRQGWRYTGTPREQAQARFLTLIESLGGDAQFTTGVEYE